MRRRTSGVVALAVLLSVLGLRGGYSVLQMLRAGRRPTVDVVVEHASISTETETYYSRGHRRTRTHHRPKVRYSYRVDGVDYTGSRISCVGRGERGVLENVRLDFGYAREMVDLMRPGDTFVAYYDPADPAEACLDTRLAPGDWLGLVFGLGLVGAVAVPASRRRLLASLVRTEE